MQVSGSSWERLGDWKCKQVRTGRDGKKGILFQKGHFLPGKGMEKEGQGKERFFYRKKKNGIGSWRSSKQGHIQGERVLGVGFGDRKEATHLDQPLQGFSEGITNTGPLLEF